MADLYFTSDTHSYVFPTDYISLGKKDMGYMALSSGFMEGAIIADGGDVLQGSPLVRYEIRHGARSFTAAEAFRRAGLSIYVPGNHDFNFGYDTLAAFLSELGADVIAANLRDIRGELGVKPYVLKTADDGLKLLFVGVITDYVNIWESPEHLEGLEITDSVSAAARALEEGRKLSPDFTICIYHGGFGDEDGPVKENRGSELAALGFDVLLTAHQHAIIEPKHIGSTLTLQTGTKAMHAAHLIFSRGGLIDAELIDADASRPLLPAMEDFPIDTEEKVIGSLSEPVGRIDGRLEDISKLSSAIHGSSLADFFNDVQLEFTGADVSAVSLFNDPVSIGPVVTLGDLLAAYPFANTLLKVKVTGKMLRDAMERSAGYFDTENGKVIISDRFTIPKEEHYNYDFYRGVSYSYDIGKPLGKRVVRLMLGDIDLLKEPEHEFTMVLNSYRATGTGGYGVYRKAEVIERYGDDVQDLLIGYFETTERVSVPKKTDFLVII